MQAIAKEMTPKFSHGTTDRTVSNRTSMDPRPSPYRVISHASKEDPLHPAGNGSHAYFDANRRGKQGDYPLQSRVSQMPIAPDTRSEMAVSYGKRQSTHDSRHGSKSRSSGEDVKRRRLV
ncbi:hypothetical protein CC2G_007994 [Coprinopsis cinerea AmutBmut pab1-1]|nr:hypothetical protein CC2G_007994 [Coprinopsis cinerea AmutBmut pab1-1]